MAVLVSVMMFLGGAALAATVPETTGLGLNAVGYLLMFAGIVALAASLAATRSN